MLFLQEERKFCDFKIGISGLQVVEDHAYLGVTNTYNNHLKKAEKKSLKLKTSVKSL